MNKSQLYLFKDRRFLPLFISQYFGCVNDNILKNAFIILVTYKSLSFLGLEPGMLVVIISALFILPFIIFAGIAGQLADKYEKSLGVKIIKFSEILICMISTYGFHNNNIYVLMVALFLIGTHSTFFGPLKYSIPPDQLDKEELMSANVYLEAGTFISILMGTILGGIYNETTEKYILGFMLAASVIGFISSLFIPKSNNYLPDLKINPNIFQESVNIMKYSLSKKMVFLSILGISWFWFIGVTILSQIPAYTKDILKADQTVITLFISTFSIGVCIGSFICNKVLDQEISAKYVVLASIVISIFGIDLFYATSYKYKHTIAQNAGILIDYVGFMAKAKNWRILLDLLMISGAGGFYVVPLYAIMQFYSSPAYRSRVIAANNIANSIFMISSTVIVGFLFYLDFNVSYVILIISLLNLAVAFYIYELIPKAEFIPKSLLMSWVRFLFDKLYKVEVKGIENFHKAGARSVIIANHISYIDPVLLSLYLPEEFSFAINTEMSYRWWVKPFLKFVNVYRVDSVNALATKKLIAEIKKNKKIAIFPEGRISVTGNLMKIYEGPGMIADKAEASILPIIIEGAQYTYFSKVRQLAKTRFFPKITINILPPVFLEHGEEDSKTRRKNLSLRLYDIMCNSLLESSGYKSDLFHSILNAAHIFGYSQNIVSDVEQNELNYRQLITRSFILGDLIARYSNPGDNIGIMLPNMVVNVVAFLGLQAYGRVPAMLNYTSGVNTIIDCINTSNIKLIITSRRFIAKSGLSETAARLGIESKVLYLEDARDTISSFDKIKGFFASFAAHFYYSHINKSAKEEDFYNSPAVILFTSGTEGKPKAVVLSHKNLLANRSQAATRIDFGSKDIAFNALPMFHSFGLTGGTLLPLLSGAKTFLYPSPLHYRIVPEMIYDVAATIMFGTDTFLAGYANFAHPYDFYSLRYVFAGAEKLRDETKKTWMEKYGIRICEGYGATETSPIVSVNTKMHYKAGTVGRLMPDVKYHIEPVDGIKEGGKLIVSGPNIMLGYMLSTKPGIIQPPKHEIYGEGWYDMGDIVTVDEEGYVSIVGRVKRFAKVGGEMISLSAIEELASRYDPTKSYASIQVSDARKGEQIILFTTSPDLDKSKLIELIKTHKFSELFLPKAIFYLEEIPVFATGKVNYPELYKNEKLKELLS